MALPRMLQCRCPQRIAVAAVSFACTVQPFAGDHMVGSTNADTPLRRLLFLSAMHRQSLLPVGKQAHVYCVRAKFASVDMLGTEASCANYDSSND